MPAISKHVTMDVSGEPIEFHIPNIANILSVLRDSGYDVHRVGLDERYDDQESVYSLGHWGAVRLPMGRGTAKLTFDCSLIPPPRESKPEKAQPYYQQRSLYAPRYAPRYPDTEE